MKVKTSAVVLVVMSVILVFSGVLYFNIILPVLSYANSEREDINRASTVIEGDDNLLNFTTPEPEVTLEPGATPMPAENSSNHKAPKIPESNINILLLGIDQDGGHADTICVLSINQEEKTMQFISIPRDSYVPYSEEICEAMKKEHLYKAHGAFKINFSLYLGRAVIHYEGGNFENSGINFMASIIENMLGYRIDEYVEVDFDGLVSLVDTFGGFDITVAENMYNDSGNLVLAEGVQHVNGTEALFYARARYRWNDKGQMLDSPGDPYRKEHQLKMMSEMASQMITVDNVMNAKNIMDSLSNAVYHSFSVEDITAYAPIALAYARGEYKMETILVEGPQIDPMNDGVCYYKIFD